MKIKKLARALPISVSIRLQVFIILILLSLIALFTAYAYKVQIVPQAEIEFTGQNPKEGIVFEKVAYISGAVENPGVYSIEKNSRVSHLIEMAGGFKSDVDSNYIDQSQNLAKLVEDGEHIYIPYSFGQIEGVKSNTKNTLINLNTASKSELESLPGVGPSTAEKIISGRPYSSIEDLLDISGIGESKFDSIKKLISVE